MQRLDLWTHGDIGNGAWMLLMVSNCRRSEMMRTLLCLVAALLSDGPGTVYTEGIIFLDSWVSGKPIDGLCMLIGQMLSISLAQTSPVDVTSGATVCPSTRVEFTCIGVMISFMIWQRNGSEILSFSTRSNAPSEVIQRSFTVILDKITASADFSSANLTSRLLFDLYSVTSGDRITCAATQSSGITLSYVQRSKL